MVTRRWRPEQLDALERGLVEAARRPGSSLPESPFGTTDDGLADYRGATLRRPVRYLQVTGADFSRVRFEDGASMNESELTGCVLDGIDLRGRFVTRRFTDCSFVAARLSRARLVGVFTDCDFTGATLTGSVASGARFERCVFTGASLRSIQWTMRCVFDHCVFDGVGALSGSLAGSVFIGTEPEDLSGCVTDHVRRA
ncbi:pentapeptide repeat-containing protein [Nocardioides sp. L-11A]|uniref:pentapeptide repeat-containing protein n=1 Tax=Nocardioides sp. L-11A TaxID=3043848 RepID=UPI00249A9212|nr:pentapeptide repeat-containing protein [Nocardioides sp. L-11A]